MEDLLTQLKSDYDSLHPIPRESYTELLPYLRIVKYPKNTLVKSASEIEMTSRYVFSGMLALFEQQEGQEVCRRIFGPSDTACDFESYHQGELTAYSIKAYTDTVAAELSRQDEAAILSQLNFWAALGIRINHRIAARDGQWRKLLWLPPRERYEMLRSLCPQFGMLKIRDIAGMLNLPQRTVFRIRQFH